MSAAPRTIWRRLWARYDEVKLIKAVFFGMVAGVIATLIIDYQEMQHQAQFEIPSGARPVPVLPAAIPGDQAPTDDLPLFNPDFITTPAETHRDAMKITLGAEGVLTLQGTIEPDTGALFAAEIEKIGEYVQTIALDSPGGALESALQMGALIRERGYNTTIYEGALCASACPLVFAGGATRTMDEKAAFGLHQIYTTPDTMISPAEAMSGAQATTARITRYLEEMGIDPKVWNFALETPPARLYYLSAEQMAEFGLVDAGQPKP